MTQHLFFILIASVTVFFSLNTGLTALMRWCAERTGYLDIPNERSSHHSATPKSGGVAIVLSFSLLVCLFYHNDYLVFKQFLALFFGGLFIGAIGYWDDHKNLSAKLRIICHFAVAIWAVALVGPIEYLQFGSFILHNMTLATVLTTLALVWLLNLYNFMDGIDGLAGSEGVFVGLGGALLIYLQHAHGLAAMCIILAAIIFGFLIWNWAPARIFMGDVGSCYLGYIFGVLLIISYSEYNVSPWAWLILLSVFFTDATYTLILRIIQGYPFYQAHRNHAFQHASQRFNSHKKVVLGVQVINLFWLLPFSLLAQHFIDDGFYIALIAYIPLFLIAGYFRAGIKDGAIQ